MLNATMGDEMFITRGEREINERRDRAFQDLDGRRVHLDPGHGLTLEQIEAIEALAAVFKGQ